MLPVHVLISTLASIYLLLVATPRPVGRLLLPVVFQLAGDVDFGDPSSLSGQLLDGFPLEDAVLPHVALAAAERVFVGPLYCTDLTLRMSSDLVAMVQTDQLGPKLFARSLSYVLRAVFNASAVRSNIFEISILREPLPAGMVLAYMVATFILLCLGWSSCLSLLWLFARWQSVKSLQSLIIRPSAVVANHDFEPKSSDSLEELLDRPVSPLIDIFAVDDTNSLPVNGDSAGTLTIDPEGKCEHHGAAGDHIITASEDLPESLLKSDCEKALTITTNDNAEPEDATVSVGGSHPDVAQVVLSTVRVLPAPPLEVDQKGDHVLSSGVANSVEKAVAGSHLEVQSVILPIASTVLSEPMLSPSGCLHVETNALSTDNVDEQADVERPPHDTGDEASLGINSDKFDLKDCPREFGCQEAQVDVFTVDIEDAELVAKEAVFVDELETPLVLLPAIDLLRSESHSENLWTFDGSTASPVGVLTQEDTAHHVGTSGLSCKYNSAASPYVSFDVGDVGLEITTAEPIDEPLGFPFCATSADDFHSITITTRLPSEKESPPFVIVGLGPIREGDNYLPASPIMEGLVTHTVMSFHEEEDCPDVSIIKVALGRAETSPSDTDCTVSDVPFDYLSDPAAIWGPATQTKLSLPCCIRGLPDVRLPKPQRNVECPANFGRLGPNLEELGHFFNRHSRSISAFDLKMLEKGPMLNKLELAYTGYRVRFLEGMHCLRAQRERQKQDVASMRVALFDNVRNVLGLTTRNMMTSGDVVPDTMPGHTPKPRPKLTSAAISVVQGHIGAASAATRR